jgi:hypothetical protein
MNERIGGERSMPTSATKHSVLAIPEGHVVVVCPTVVSAESRRRILYAIEALMTEKPPRADPLVGLAELAALEGHAMTSVAARPSMVRDLVRSVSRSSDTVALAGGGMS